MSRAARIITVIAALGTCWGAGWAVFIWREQVATGQQPPFMVEGLGLVVAPPFGIVLAYLVGALVFALPEPASVGYAATLTAVWTLLTAAANWTLVGLCVAGAWETLANGRAGRRRRAAR